MSFGGKPRTTDVRKYVIPSEECTKNENHSISGLMCNATWDSITCWPATPAGRVATQPCPPVFGADFDKSVYKRCGQDGHWERSEFWKGFGHSDYGECIDHISALEEVFELDEKVGESGQTSYQIDSTKGIVAVTLLTISLMFLLVSIISVNFIIPRTVNQTAQYKICRHVFPVFMVDTVINLVEKIFFLIEIHYGLSYRTVTNTPIMCEILITIKEYACLTTYTWLLIQCRHLQRRTTSVSGQYSTSGIMVYCLLGWGVPVIPTTIWVLAVTLSHGVTCWAGYRIQKIFWIIDSSKLVIMLATVACLVYAIRQLLKSTGIIEKALNKNERDDCFKRIRYETISCALFVGYVMVVIVITLLNNHISLSREISERRDLACIVIESSKGLVLTTLFWSFNLDIRALWEINIRRVSHQELVPSTNDIEENVL